MDRWIGKVAIVTGASSGIGAAIAESLVKFGLRVVGIARRLDRLEELSASLKGAKGKFHPRQCDLSKEEELLDAFRWVNSKFGGVDILISNAGVSKHKHILDDDIESFRKILDVNILAAAVAIREAVTSMKRRDVEGYIITVNSVLGHQYPSIDFVRSLYPSSKQALRALTDTVRKELAAKEGNKIKITSLSPGLVKTEMSAAAGGIKTMYQAPHIQTDDVVEAISYLLSTRPSTLVTELTIRSIREGF